jgi:lipopolysaccharide/colanic/teichoic acid biosynthesis glycosyltransferase
MTRLHRIVNAAGHVLATSGLASCERIPEPTVPIRGRGARDTRVRHLNLLVAVAGIVVLLPLTAVIALAVRLTSAGPVLFHQERVGHNRRRGRSGKDRRGRPKSAIPRRTHDAGGRVFTMYKFRTMYAREEGCVAREVWAAPADSRITPLGSVLRAYRLDELPQLFNVLKGDMNVVGPRPEQPRLFQELRSQVERYPERQVVLPGITGWAQVNHSYDQCLDDVRRKVELDLEYIDRRSPSEDLRIMARTLPVVIGKRGAL